jgi:hypothetical protein
VGVRCFADFDKGLLSAKVHGQSYTPVKGPGKADSLGDYSHFLCSDVNAKTKYLSGAETPGSPTIEQKGNYQAGINLAQRISIE